jgi:hypothetical protein
MQVPLWTVITEPILRLGSVRLNQNELSKMFILSRPTYSTGTISEYYYGATLYVINQRVEC